MAESEEYLLGDADSAISKLDRDFPYGVTSARAEKQPLD